MAGPGVRPAENDALPAPAGQHRSQTERQVESDSVQLDRGLKRPTRHSREARALQLRAGPPGRQTVQRGLGPKEFTMGASGITADHTASFDPAGAEYHAPGTDRCSIADYGPVRNAHCASDDHVVTDLDAAGNPRCRHDQATGSRPHVMADLHQVVDLGASSDDGVGKRYRDLMQLCDPTSTSSSRMQEPWWGMR